MTTEINKTEQHPASEEKKRVRTFRIFNDGPQDPESARKRGLKRWKQLFERMGVRNGSPLRSEQDRVRRETIDALLALDLEHLKAGDQIYIPSDYHNNQADRNLLGGLATVTEIIDDQIKVKEDPHGRYLVHALRNQLVMKSIFGMQRARLWTEEDSAELLEQQPVLPEDHPRRTWASRFYDAILRKRGLDKRIRDEASITIHTIRHSNDQIKSEEQ